MDGDLELLKEMYESLNELYIRLVIRREKRRLRQLLALAHTSLESAIKYLEEKDESNVDYS